jgi:chromosome segregation ATPase
MSLPAKVFVVINFVLAVALSVAALSTYAKKANYVKQAQALAAQVQEAEEAREVALAEAKKARDEVAQATQRLQAKVDLFQEKYNSAEQARAQLDRRNAELVSSINKVENEMGNIRTELKSLLQDKKAVQAQLAKRTQELEKARDDRNFMQKSALESTADLKELQAQLEATNKRAAELMEQNLQLNVTLENLRERYDIGEITLAAAPVEPVRGRIVRTVSDAGLVVLSVGTDDNVQQGMEFMVSRGTDYVGKVRVRTTERDMATAVVLPDVTQGEIIVGDLAETY